MLVAHITQRLEACALLPELRSALHHLAAQDEEQTVRGEQWNAIIPALQRILGDADDVIAPFLAAWSLMYSAISRLDQLQDDDPVEEPLPGVDRPNAQYNLVFSYYILAEALLDDLSPEHIPTYRIVRLRRLWTDTMLRMASGQQRDLLATTTDIGVAPLDDYQQIAQAKTGSTFALAFAGPAILLSDDLQLINTLMLIGEIYGTLLQYGDDISDAPIQSNRPLTLPTTFNTARPAYVSEQHTLATFWPYLYRLYREQVAQALVDFPANVRQGILDLFATTFES